jgi:hypothetical protein
MKKIIVMLIISIFVVGCSAKQEINYISNNQNEQYDYIIDIKIKASKEKVWDIITNFSDYPKWNSVLKMQNNDDFEIGKEFNVTIFNKDGSIADNFPAIAIEKIPYKQFWASSTMLHKNLFKATHYFVIEEISANEIKFIQKWKLEGVVSYLFESMIFEQLDLFILMNDELKKEAEK